MKNSNADKLNELKKILNCIRKYNDDGLDQFVVDEDSLSLPDELFQEAAKMLEILNFLSKEYNNNTFLEDIFEENEENFKDWINEYLDYKRKTTGELLFIREMEEIDFKNLFKFIMDNYILEYNEIESYDKYDEKQIKIAIKAMNTFVKMVIDELFSKKTFDNYSKDIFEFSSDKSNYIWELINSNKNELRYINLVKKLK